MALIDYDSDEVRQQEVVPDQEEQEEEADFTNPFNLGNTIASSSNIAKNAGLAVANAAPFVLEKVSPSWQRCSAP